MAAPRFTTLITPGDLESAEPRFVDGVPRSRLLQVAGPLYLQITPSKVASDGTYTVSKSWLFKFSIDGHRTGMGLGPLAKLPLDEAILEARELQKKVDRKENPLQEERRKRREREQERNRPPEITFADAAKAYADAHEAEWTAKDYKHRWLAVLERHAYQVIGKVPVADITVEHILQVLEPLWASEMTKTGKDLRGRISDVLGWAMAKGYRPKAPNPAAWSENLEHLLAKPAKPDNHPAIDYTKAGAFMAELRTKKWLGARATEFAILTVSRANEVIGMRWGEVNWNHNLGPLWTVPAERMKRRRKHIVPLSKAAQAILRGIKGDRTPDPGALVFHGEYGQLAENALLKSVQRIDPSVTQHGFRATFSSWRNDRTEFDAEVAEFALAHVKKGVEGVYNRSTAILKRRELMEACANYLNVVEGENVVTLTRRAARKHVNH
jgi:integrase